MVSVILSNSSLYVILIIKLVTVHHVLIGGLASKEANIPTIIRNIETSSSNSFACQFFSALISPATAPSLILAFLHLRRHLDLVSITIPPFRPCKLFKNAPLAPPNSVYSPIVEAPPRGSLIYIKDE